MASKQSVRKPYLLTCVLLVFTWITDSDGVTIQQKSFITVTVRDTEEVVTLPCNFITSPYEAPVITWLWYTDKDTRQVTRFENQQLFSQKEFSTRVARGDKGALVLIRPTRHDSGNYSCEVEVEKENPRFAITFITLEVRLSRTEVTIPKVHRQVKALDTDTSVTLPCDYTAVGPDIPRIIWRLVKEGHTKDIGTFDKDGGLSLSDQFVDRLARGTCKRGDLVLIAPRVEDSGTYKCTIQVDKGQPVAADVKLLVSSSSDANQLVPFQSAGLEVFVCILWIIPVFCGFVLEEKRLAMIIHILRTMRSSKQLFLKGWRYIVIVLALCLIFSGNVCSVKALSSGDLTDFNYNRAVGYGTGISGIVFLCGVYMYMYIALIKLCVANCSSKETMEKRKDNADTETAANPAYGFAECKDGHETEQINLMPQTEAQELGEREDYMSLGGPDKATPTISIVNGEKVTGLNSLSAKGVYLTTHDSDNPTAHKEEPQILTIGIPNNEKVTGITSMPAQGVYMTTHESLYRLNPSSEGDKPELEVDWKQKYDLMMVSQYKHGLLLLGKTLGKKYGWFSSYDKYIVMPVRLEDKKLNKVYSEQPISCVFSQLHSEDIYLIYPDTQQIIKAMIKGEKFYNSEGDINTSVLKHPTCIVKNSRDQIIVTDSVKNDVFVFDENTGFVTSMKISVPKDLEPELQGCNRLAVGPDDRIYVTGPFTRYVFVFGADFRFERVIQTVTETSGQISCLMIHDNSLYVAHCNCVRVYPLSDK